MLVLDLEGRIVRSNRALQYFLDPGTPTERVKVEEWVLPRSRSAFLAAWQRALAGERLRVAVALKPTPFLVDPIFELSALSEAGRARFVMMLVVDAVAAPVFPVLPALGSMYEVAFDGLQPGRLIRELSQDRLREGESSAPCFRVLHDRARPCDSCPLRRLKRKGVNSVVRLEAEHPFKAQILSARMVREGVAAISVVPIDQRTFSEVVRYRLRSLGTENRLTVPEQRLFSLLLTNARLDDIAVALGVSTRTVKRIQRRLHVKLDAGARLDLVRLLTR